MRDCDSFDLSERRRYLSYSLGGNLYNNLSALITMQSATLDNGMFFFCKPGDRRDFVFQNDFKKGASTLTVADATYPLQSPYDYMGTCASSTGQFAGDLAVRNTQAIEFKTSSQAFSLLPPEANQEAMKFAMNAVATMRQFYSNPIHWEQIMSSLGTAAKAAPKVMEMFSQWIPSKAMQIGKAIASGVARGAEFFQTPSLQAVESSPRGEQMLQLEGVGGLFG